MTGDLVIRLEQAATEIVALNAERDVLEAMLDAGTSAFARRKDGLNDRCADRLSKMLDVLRSMIGPRDLPGVAMEPAVRGDVLAAELVLNAALRGRALAGVSGDGRAWLNELARDAADRAGLGRLVIASETTEVVE